MSWLEFIVQMAEALAWPTVASGAILLLRRQIKAAVTALVARVGDLKRLKAAGVDLKFREEVKELAASTSGELSADNRQAISASEPKGLVLPPETADDRFAKYEELQAVDPKAAVLVSFADLESLIRQEFQKRFPEEKRVYSFVRLLNILADKKLLNEDLYESLRELAILRNRVAHESAEVDRDVAYYYVQSIGNVLGHLYLTGFFKPEA